MNDELTGFGRKIFSNGHQFVGWLQNAQLHGYAELELSNGRRQKGIFKNGELRKEGVVQTEQLDNSFQELEIDFSNYIAAMHDPSDKVFDVKLTKEAIEEVKEHNDADNKISREVAAIAGANWEKSEGGSRALK